MVLAVLISCDGEEPEALDCSQKQTGSMYVKFSEVPGQEVDYNLVLFEERNDSILMIYANYFTELCELRVSHNFMVINDLMKQPLIPLKMVDGQALIGSTYFQTLDHDATTEGFDLFEDEPAWFQFTELGEKQVRGVFQATYVYRPGYVRAWNLPDTLRFNNVEFTAELVEN